MTTKIDFEAIKASVSISDVLSRYTRTFPKRKYRIRCPIHGGTDDYNFAVDDELGLWNCFSHCGGGDVISLFAKLENISNLEAAKRMTEAFRINPGFTSPSFRSMVNEVKLWTPSEPQEEIVLPDNRPLNGYRGYSTEAIRHFDLRLVNTGVLIPIRDGDGRCVGYAVRQVTLQPKYLNSTNLRKNELLYGWFENKNDIIEKKKVIVCEGQFSAIRCWDKGFRNVVATMGAGMSPNQVHLIVPYINRVVVLYDGDSKGREAASKIKENFSTLFEVEIVDLPDGTDPDTVADLNQFLN